MTRILSASLPVALALSGLTVAAPSLAQDADALAAARAEATQDRIALDFTEALTSEVGPRQAGTEAEARARAWAVARLTSMGFSNVRVEEYSMPTWVRGEERASIVAPFPQPLTLTALGNSGATPARGLEAEVIAFPDLQNFESSSIDVRGKIVYVSHSMRVTQDGSSYGQSGAVRFRGPDVAARRGAAAMLIRSVGTDSHRTPHTGVTTFGESVRPIPAAALSNPDADNLERILRRATEPVRIELLLTPRNIGQQTSGNVIAEIEGSDPSAGIVVAACHLDSWDLGTGAIDDAAGCGIITAAALRAADVQRPRRTIRLLFAGAEEVGVWGGRAYGAAHATDRHAAALESDFGAGRVWRVGFRLPEGAAGLADRIAYALAPLGVGRGTDPAHGGADIGPLAEAGVPLVDLRQDGTRYFDLHHTADDTFDKIDPQELAQNVAAWTVTLTLLANAPETLGEAGQ